MALGCVTLCGAAYTTKYDSEKTISQFTHTSWSARSGVPGPIQAIAQTSDGYLWLGTQGGLYRFDGMRFAAWESSAGEQLPRSSVLSLCSGRDGSLWIGFAASAISHLQNGRLRTYTPAQGLHSGGVLAIAEDLNGSIWAGGEYGFSEFAHGQWRPVGAAYGYPAPGARALLVDRKGVLWVATDGRNMRFGTDAIRTNTIMFLPPNANCFQSTKQGVGFVPQIAEAANGDVWIVEDSGPRPTVRRLNGRSEENIERAMRGGPRALIFDGPEHFWVGLTEGGVRRIRNFMHTAASSIDELGESDHLSSNDVLSGFKDREGNIWFGTAEGLDRFRDAKATPISIKQGLISNREIGLTSTDDGSLWIISYTQNFVQCRGHGSWTVSKLPSYSRTDSTRILSLYAQHNEVWLGGSFGLARGVGGRFSFISGLDLYRGETVEAITKDAAGGLWIVAWEPSRGPRVMRLRDGRWVTLADQGRLPKYHCRVLYGDALGGVWLGFENGSLGAFKNDTLRVYSTADGLPGGRILSIAAGQGDGLLIGSESGLSRFEKGRFVTIVRRNGLPGDSVSAILNDDDGNFWLVGALGIVRVAPQELDKAFRSAEYSMQGLLLDENDGLRGLPRQKEPFPLATRAADGKLWFATSAGIAVINPRRLPKNLLPPPVSIEKMTVDNRGYFASPDIQVPANPRAIEINFAGLSLSAPERILFRYKLDGYDEDWHEPVTTRSATYTNLPPRHYRFHVIACNRDGVWNDAGAIWDFDVSPAFYQTNQFFVICLMAASLIGYSLYRWRVGLITAQTDQRWMERVAERERIARELHDTLLQSIQGLALRFHGIAKRMPESNPTRAMIDKALDRADEVMVEGRNRVRGLRSCQTPGADLPEGFASIGNELLQIRDANFRVIAEGVPRQLNPITQDEVYQIGREALMNAFQHSRGSRIEAEISYAPRELRLRFRDDGCGIDTEVLEAGGKISHWGLRGMQERARKIGGHLDIRSRAGAGTELELRIPAVHAYRSGPWPLWGLLRRGRERLA